MHACTYILESVVMGHEVIHEVKKSGSQGLVLKLDYEKAYDRVNWDFFYLKCCNLGVSAPSGFHG